MTGKKRNTQRYKKRHSMGLWFLLVFLIILTVSLFLGYYFSHTGKMAQKLPPPVNKEQPTDTNKNPMLSGTWVSNYDGAILEFKGKNFTIEIPSVDNNRMIRGSYSLKGNTITFIYQTNEGCGEIPGKYVVFRTNSKLQFRLISDACKNRVERMSEGWFPL